MSYRVRRLYKEFLRILANTIGRFSRSFKRCINIIILSYVEEKRSTSILFKYAAYLCETLPIIFNNNNAM